MVSASRGTVYLIAAQGVFVLAGFIFNAYLARALGAVEFGMLGVAVTFALVITTFITAGLTGATAKFIAEDEKRGHFVNHYVTKTLLVLSAACVAFILLFAEQLAAALGNSLLAWPLRFASLIIPAQAVYNQRISLHSAFKEFGASALGIASLAVAKLAIAGGLVATGFGIIGALVSHIASPIVAYIISGKRALATGAKFDKGKIVEYSWPYSLSAGLLLLVQNVDILAVQALVQNGITTGLYVASTTLARAMVVLLGAIAIGIFPSIALLSSQKSPKTEAYVRTTLLYAFTLVIPIAFLLSAGAYNVLAIFFSEQYVAATPFLQILSLSAAMTTIIFVCFGMLNAAGETRKTLKLTIFVLLVELLLAWFGAMRYGATGLAYGVLASTALTLAATLFILQKEFGNVFPWVQLAKLIAAGVVAGFAFLVVQYAFSTKWAVIPAGLVGFACYAVLLALLRAYSKEEVILANSFAPKVFLPLLTQVERLLGYKV